MKQEKLFEAIGLVDDHLVEEAADARRVPVPWKKWLATAACLVAVVGIGSLTVGTMFRGCGASSSDAAWDDAAPENEMAFDAAASSDSAAAEEYSWTDDEACDDAAPEDAADAAAAPGGMGGGFDYYADPVLPLTAVNGERLSAQRNVHWDIAEDGSSALITDSYQVTNTTEELQTVTFSYPVAASLNTYEEAGLQIRVGPTSATNVAYEIYGGEPLAGLTEDGLNLSWHSDSAELAQRLEAGEDLAMALQPAQPQQQVTVWRFEDVRYDRATIKSGGSLAVWFELPEDTQVLTYGINGCGTRDGLTAYDFFVASNWNVASHDLIFLGNAPEDYTVQGYVDGGMEQVQDDITGTIRVLEMTLEEYLRGVTGSELEYQTLAKLLEQTVLSGEPPLRYDPAMLDMMLLSDNRAMQRIFYATFDVAIPAGEEVEIVASYTKEASSNFYTGPDSETDLYGFDLLTTAGSSLEFTEQTASLMVPKQLTLEEESFGFFESVPAVLDPEKPYYAMKVRK